MSCRLRRCAPGLRAPRDGARAGGDGLVEHQAGLGGERLGLRDVLGVERVAVEAPYHDQRAEGAPSLLMATRHKIDVTQPEYVRVPFLHRPRRPPASPTKSSSCWRTACRPGYELVC
jgi:hypothetical protein